MPPRAVAARAPCTPRWALLLGCHVGHQLLSVEYMIVGDRQERACPARAYAWPTDSQLIS
jgi:hypothetical protein